MTFAERLKELRVKSGKTQEGLAVESAVPVGTLRGYEQGKRIPGFGAIVRLAIALGTDCRAFADCSDLSDNEPTKPAKKRR